MFGQYFLGNLEVELRYEISLTIYETVRRAHLSVCVAND